jgi:predicted alpha/beta-fold hydrolase
VPAKLIAAAEDPVIPVEDLVDLSAPSSLSVEVLRRGGHCAFLEDYRLRSWLDRTVLAEIEAAS